MRLSVASVIPRRVLSYIFRRHMCSDSVAVQSLASTIQNYKRAVRSFQVASAAEPSSRARDIFVNNEVRLDSIDVVGFDLDFTLAGYNHRMSKLVYELGRDFLINMLSYPSAFRSVPYDPSFGVRGITLDINHGTLLKLDYNDRVTPNCAFRGRTRLSSADVAKLYGGMHVSRSYRELNMKAMVDMFAMSEACLVANLIQHFMDQQTEFSSRAVAEDVFKAISFVHSSGAMHNEVSINPGRYLDKDGDLSILLQRLKDSGTQLFLLTNSSFGFANAVLKYLLGEDWRAYFNVVIVDANKPKFYSSNKPFREVDTTRNRMRWDEVTALRPGRVYAQGCVEDLMALQGWKGQRVLYVGDNIVSDTIVPRKTHGWVTGVILPELENHMKVHDSDAVRSIDTQMLCLDSVMRMIQSPALREGAASVLTAGVVDMLREFLSERSLFESSKAPFLEINQVTEFLDVLEAERDAWRRRKQLQFHTNFGSEFTSGTSPTLFAMTVTRYVDVYTSRVTNFLRYPGDYRFYPEMKLLPHQQPHTSTLPELEPAAPASESA